MKTNHLTTDPVCGMSVSPETAQWKTTHNYQTYYFCNSNCLIKFKKKPDFYLQPSEKKSSPADLNAIYTCPMHPAIRQQGPGSCPICGMALEPMNPMADDDESELISITRRFWVCGALTLPILLLSMGPMVFNFLSQLPPITNGYLQFLLATPVVGWGAWPFFERGWRSLLRLTPNMFTLISLGILVAYLQSCFTIIIAPSNHHLSLYFESSTVITVLVLLGQIWELKARQKTSLALRSLLSLTPAKVRRITPSGDEDVPLEHIRVNDTIRIRSGEKIAVDGMVMEGSSFVNESMITGESVPVEKTTGMQVTAGTLNGSGQIIVRAEKIGRGTLLGRMIQAVADAQRSRAPIQNLVDKVASVFVPAVAVASLLTFLVWSVFIPNPDWRMGLINAVAVLIIACPCALGLATPMSIVVGMGQGALHGILFKNADALQRMESIHTLVMDKTGTLTQGQPTVTHIHLYSTESPRDVLQLAASLELASEHPLAQALVRKAREEGLKLTSPQNFKALPGAGVMGQVDNRTVLVGTRNFLESEHIQFEKSQRDEHQIWVARDQKLLAGINLEDPLKISSKTAVAQLQNDGFHLVLLSGDRPSVANSIAKELGIIDVRAGVPPLEKETVIKSLRAEGRKVAMVGDGINDAAALAAADVGIAMGTGSDTAIEGSDMTLVNGDLSNLTKAIRLSRRTMINIRQNLFLAFVYNAVSIPIAAGALYPTFGLLLSPMIAALAMSLSSVSVITNALRLRNLHL